MIASKLPAIPGPLDLSPQNPFRVLPVKAGGFFGRTRELDLLIQRSLGTGESTIVVSEFPNGKGSLLREFHQHLCQEAVRVSFIDAHSLPNGCTPGQFWSQALVPFGASRRLRYAYRDIESLVAANASNGPCVLVLDGLQVLAHLPAFRCPDLWGMLRAFTQSQGLVLIGASSVDLVTLTELTRGLTRGSPFFNAMREVVLGPIEADAVISLLSQADPWLGPEDRAWVDSCTGGIPKLIHLLASCLWDRTVRLGPSPATRMHALAECRSELHNMFSAAWPLFPWEERWFMLRVALAQRCGLEFYRTQVKDVARQPLSSAESEASLIRLIEQRLTRDELKRLLRETSEQSLELLLPGDGAIGLTFYTEAASLLVRHGLVPCFLERMLQWLPACREEITSLAQTSQSAPGGPSGGWQPVNLHIERLAARGLLERSMQAPGWRLKPPLFYWWLVDRIQALVGSEDLNHWMAQHELLGSGRLSLAEGRVFALQCMHNAELLRGGATVLIEEFVR